MFDEKIDAKQIYEEFCNWSPEHAKMAKHYEQWGNTSIAIWFDNGLVFKVKRYAPNRFIMQLMSNDDIKRKYEIIK